jgi:hypothetical protein
MKTKYIVFGSILLALIGLGVFLISQKKEEPTPEPVPVVEEPYANQASIGTSVEGRNIASYTFGNGEEHLVFVGTIHGGYEWNTALLSYKLVDYLIDTPNAVPENVKVTVIPVLNPDGLQKIVGSEGRFDAVNAPAVGQTYAGRFNANEVDLNRNFDCNWAPTSTWRSQTVSAGANAFSEPEALAFKQFTEKEEPDVVVFFHSSGDGVYSSACNNGVLLETQTAMNVYSQGSGYPAQGLFDAYPITGDAEGWLATIGIPALTVELSTHEVIEWQKNKAGVEALIRHYNNK